MGPTDRIQKFSPPPGFDPRTVQPVTSRYTDGAVPTLYGLQQSLKLKNTLFLSNSGPVMSLTSQVV